MEHIQLSRDSIEYAEIVAEVFVETVRKYASEAMCCEHENEEITRSLMECLQYVYLHGPSPIRQIAGGLEMTLSAASQLVDRLVKKELVTRRENETDRRLIAVELTPAGHDIVKQMRKRRSDWFESVLGVMNEDKRKALLESLEGFLSIALANDDNIDHACVRCGMEHVSFCVIHKVKNERSPEIEI